MEGRNLFPNIQMSVNFCNFAELCLLSKSKKHFICLFSVFSPEAAEESVPSKGEKEEPMDVQESETPATNEWVLELQ